MKIIRVPFTGDHHKTLDRPYHSILVQGTNLELRTLEREGQLLYRSMKVIPLWGVGYRADQLALTEFSFSDSNEAMLFKLSIP